MQNCGVAQTYDGDESRNVVTGSFASPDQTDWVVLCARGDSTGIVIVWGGPERCPSSLSWTPNDAWMQELDGQRAFSRAVQVADQQFIQEHAEAYGGMAAPSDDHDGVDDVFMGKGSTVRYCHQGAWTELQGAD